MFFQSLFESHGHSDCISNASSNVKLDACSNVFDGSSSTVRTSVSGPYASQFDSKRRKQVTCCGSLTVLKGQYCLPAGGDMPGALIFSSLAHNAWTNSPFSPMGMSGVQKSISCSCSMMWIERTHGMRRRTRFRWFGEWKLRAAKCRPSGRPWTESGVFLFFVTNTAKTS